MKTQPEVLTPRRKCYHAVRGAISHRVAEYYKKHPDKIDDQCAEDLVETCVAVAVAVLAVLDEYDIFDKPPISEVKP